MTLSDLRKLGWTVSDVIEWIGESLGVRGARSINDLSDALDLSALRALPREPWMVTPPSQIKQNPDRCRCALEGTRTPNLLIRSQMLYPLSYERSAAWLNLTLDRQAPDLQIELVSTSPHSQCGHHWCGGRWCGLPSTHDTRAFTNSRSN